MTPLVRMSLRKLGRVGLVCILTMLSTLLAITFNFILVELLDYSYLPEQDIVIICIITMTVTPLLSWYLIGLFFKIDVMEVEMAKLATIDSLTNTYHRGYFYQKSDAYLSTLSALKQENQSALLVLDLDNLKQINDQFGHAGGDAVLIEFSRILLDVVKKPNMVARLGGDEFVVLFTQTSLEDAQAFAFDILARMRSTTLEFNGQPLSFSASIGVSSFTGDDEQALDAAIKSADSALYDVKRAGRNDVAVYKKNQA